MACISLPICCLSTLILALLGHVCVEGHKERFVVDGGGEMNVEQLMLSLQQEVLQLRKELDLVKASSSTRDAASVYTRWGRTGCQSNGSVLVYHGYTSGRLYSENGGGDNYLCLPSDPTWGKYDPGFQTFRGRIYGTEYEIDQDPSMLFGKAIHNQDAPCAVCKIPRTVSVMIPARTSCYPGWNMEYSGYLMTMHHAHPASMDYICMDSQPEFIDHGSGNSDQSVVYPVESACGALPCPPYEDGRELACVVCSV